MAVFSIATQRTGLYGKALDNRASARPVCDISDRRQLVVKAFRNGSSSSRKGATKAPSKKNNKQRTILPPNAPRNSKENSESVVLFIGVASLFLTGVLFVFPALLGGSPATTQPLQKGINKALNIKEPANTNGKSYAPGPGPAAAPGTAATEM